MTDDIDNDATTLHESGGVVQPTDAQAERGAFESALCDIVRGTGQDASQLDFNRETNGEYVNGQAQIAWILWQARAVLQAPLQAEPVPVVASEPVAWMRAGANPWHGWEACAEGDPNGFPVYRATPQAEPAVAEQAREELETRLRSMSRTLANIASDPMWSNHAEISKRTLNRASEVMTLALSALASQSTPPPESAGLIALMAEALASCTTNGRVDVDGDFHPTYRFDGALVDRAMAAFAAANPTAQPDGGSKA